MDLIGVSLVTASTHDLKVGAGYITDVVDKLENRTNWHTLHSGDGVPMLYFGQGEIGLSYEEVTINFADNVPTKLLLNSDRYEGKLFVNGGNSNDHFIVHNISGQTFLNGGAGNDVFDVGQGTVDKISNGLFLQGGEGNDSVFVYQEESIEASAVTLEKQTVQHTLTEEKLSRVTNALEFTNITDDENAAMAEALQAVSVEYAQLAALVDANDLRTIATKAAMMRVQKF